VVIVDRQFALPSGPSFRPTLGFAASLLLHAAITAPIVIPDRAKTESQDRIDQLVVFLVPPDVEGTRSGAGPGVEWAGAKGEEGTDQEAPPPPPEPEEGILAQGDPGPRDSTTPRPLGEPEPVETALTEIEVDSTVERDPTSASPVYPPEMLERKISGSTFVNYVVDTTGRVDVGTIRVVRTTHSAFAVAVREALAKMRFRPAIQGSRKVRQWVEQSFAFKIVPPARADTSKGSGAP